MCKIETRRSAMDWMLKEKTYIKTKSKMFREDNGNQIKKKYTSRNRKWKSIFQTWKVIASEKLEVQVVFQQVRALDIKLRKGFWKSLLDLEISSQALIKSSRVKQCFIKINFPCKWRQIVWGKSPFIRRNNFTSQKNWIRNFKHSLTHRFTVL
jgi:hypothetical protein